MRDVNAKAEQIGGRIDRKFYLNYEGCKPPNISVIFVLPIVFYLNYEGCKPI